MGKEFVISSPEELCELICPGPAYEIEYDEEYDEYYVYWDGNIVNVFKEYSKAQEWVEMMES